MQVTRQRLQHMLPGTNGIGVTNRNRYPGFQCVHHIGNDAVLDPIATTNYVAGTGTGDAFMMAGIFFYVEEGIAITADDDLCTGFASTVRIVSTQAVRL